MRLIEVILLALLARAQDPSCKYLGSAEVPDLSKEGDIIIGGIFSYDTLNIEVKHEFNVKPTLFKCKRKNYREYKLARTMVFTIAEINRNNKLLPGVTLGYRIYNACGDTNILNAALAAAAGPENCSSARIQALIGPPSSGASSTAGKAIAPLHIPLISHLATCDCLSNRKLYPSFFRTVPSDRFQVIALVELLKYYGWTWVGFIYSNEMYAEEGAAAFTKLARKEEICIEYITQFIDTAPEEHVLSIAKTIKTSTAKVVLAFMSMSFFRKFLEMTKSENITGIQWIGSEAWIITRDLATVGSVNLLQGAMGFAITECLIPGLRDFLLSLRPSDHPESSFTRVFWETAFSCRLSVNSSSGFSKLCNETEDVRTITNDYTDMSESRTVYSVYKGVYAIAHALHSLLDCVQGENPITGEPCSKKDDIQPWQVLRHLKIINFITHCGDKVYFDENGASVPQYDLVNWQIDTKGFVRIINVGRYDASLPSGQRLKIKQNVSIVWTGNQDKVPQSVCTESCLPGTRKALNKRRPVCCFDCIHCAEGEISNQTDSVTCIQCPDEYWSNENRDQCVSKVTEFLSYDEIMGTLLLAFACFGALLALIMLAVFLHSKNTPIVRANNSELSFLLLFSLTLCFLCSLTFIGRPSHWSCMLRHTAFGITFVLCISCVLGKTIVVLMAFRATLPGSNVMKWFGPSQQRLSVLAFTLIQVLICVLWLTLSPPFPNKNMKYYKDKIILECDVGSAVGFWAVLGYIGLLSALCFVLAFLARKLPDNFNEAKFITFSMLIFCAVWITFIPAYVSSPGKFTVAVEIFAILASSFGLLFSIFLPKCYIIIFKPELNSKKHLMGKMASKSL
ncbi:extracellular calcium-sensing receptor-like [Brienomyrus brachyistius]|uniref:extracellular calcium-sensing receptor-like n=1 Tax=Brienomyrus brachyistius TaxID=42636 RepID=UPI0020B206C7|nr:extracellular calcium-sensing receptor-like [Brienomyrus brachyistius]